MYVWTQVVLFFLLLVTTMPALGAMCKWPGLNNGTINKELAYGMLLAHYLPAGLLGLAVSGLAASIMSTVSSNLNFGAQVFLSDVYRRSLVPKASVGHYMNVGRVVMFVIMGLALLVATKAENLIDVSVFMLGLSSAEITANWGQWWWWRFNGAARLAASFGGPVIFLVNKYLLFQYLIPVKGDVGYIVVLSSIAATFALWFVVALLTRPEPEAKLIEFYKRSRPLGWWGPIAAKVAAEERGAAVRPAQNPAPRGARPIVKGLGIALLGAAMVAAGTIAFSCAYVGSWRALVIFGLLSVATGLAFKRLYGNYLRSLGTGEDA